MRYYLNIRDGETLIEDSDGDDFPNPAAALGEALQSARELMADNLRSGRPLNGRLFEIRDEAGALVGELPFKSAIPAG